MSLGVFKWILCLYVAVRTSHHISSNKFYTLLVTNKKFKKNSWNKIPENTWPIMNKRNDSSNKENSTARDNNYQTTGNNEYQTTGDPGTKQHRRSGNRRSQRELDLEAKYFGYKIMAIILTVGIIFLFGIIAWLFHSL